MTTTSKTTMLRCDAKGCNHFFDFTEDMDDEDMAICSDPPFTLGGRYPAARRQTLEAAGRHGRGEGTAGVARGGVYCPAHSHPTDGRHRHDDGYADPLRREHLDLDGPKGTQ